MRKLIAISFVFLAMTFCFKSIINYVSASADSLCLIMDIDEEESSEKENTDEKSDTEEFQLSLEANLLALNSFYKNYFHNHIINEHSTPVFEINSPPPEFII